MNFPATIAQFITEEEAAYRTREIEVSDNNMWNMSDHIRISTSMKLGKFIASSNDLQTKPAKRNIILPILRLRYRLQDIDVKDILIYVDDPDKAHYSFLIKKYWEDVFLIENDFDGFLDRMHRDPIDYGGGLVKEDFLPEVIPLQRIAFCDQTNVLGGPIGLKYNFAPDELRAKSKQGWGKTENGATISINDLIAIAKKEKSTSSQHEANKNKTTGKNVEVYVVRGEMPTAYLGDKENLGIEEELVNQLQIVAFYQSEEDQREFQVLYRKKETKQAYKFYNPEEVFNRGLGMGGVEELFDAQMWTDFAQKAKHDMLEAASKNVLYTDDEAYSNRNKIKDLDNLEVTVVKDGAEIKQVPTASPNINLFTQAFQEWEDYANNVGGRQDALEGKQPPVGTPFRLQERVVFEGKGLHEYRRGRFAKFIEEVMRDWIIPRIAKEIVNGKRFLATLSADEMHFLMERLATNRAARTQIEDMLEGRIPEDIEMLKQKARMEFLAGGNKQVFEILKDELKDVELKVKINISGKQKDLSMMVDKLTNVIREYMANPLMRQDPIALKLLNRIMEASGLPTVDFADLQLPVPMQLPPGQQQPGQQMPQQPVQLPVNQPVLA